MNRTKSDLPCLHDTLAVFVWRILAVSERFQWVLCSLFPSLYKDILQLYCEYQLIIFQAIKQRSNNMIPEITYIQHEILGRKREVNRGQFFSQQTLKFKRLIFKIVGFRQVTFVFRKNDSKC